MADTPETPNPSQEQPPTSYWIEQELNWDAPSAPVLLSVELPFWLMVSDCTLKIECCGHLFDIEIRSGLFELYLQQVTDSHDSCVWIGPNPDNLDPELRKNIEEEKLPVLPRKCKTILRIHTSCNEDVLSAEAEEDARRRVALKFLSAFCGAHLEVVNTVVQRYRQSTYDFFPYEVSPWDVPVWFLEVNRSLIRIALLEYASWNHKPVLFEPHGSSTVYRLISSEELQASVTQPGAGELELLDAMNFMERGDYSDAVRRITTAIEVILEAVLRQELLKHHPVTDVERMLHASRNDFPGRLRQYQRLSGRTLPTGLAKELDDTRDLRHEIVHRASRISFRDRGRAQRAVDTGRWIYNWFENNAPRSQVREKQIAMRSLGRHFSIFHAEITSTGVVVHKPTFTL